MSGLSAMYVVTAPATQQPIVTGPATAHAAENAAHPATAGQTSAAMACATLKTHSFSN